MTGQVASASSFGVSLRCHALAALRAFPAHIGAILHDRVFPEASAIGLALAADIGAGAADLSVNARAAGHRSGRCLADCGAIQHKGDVLSVCMLAALLEAMRDCGIARCRAVLAVVDTLRYFGADRLVRVVHLISRW